MVQLSKCKITVIKKTLNRDLIDKYIIDDYQEMGCCEKFKTQQEFIIDPNSEIVPENFCRWAWADMRKEIMMIASGGQFEWYKNPKMTIVGCTDWFRPVFFKIEKID